MHKFSSKALVSAFCAALGLAAAGCGQIATLQATMAFKDANQLYRGQDFRAAVTKYTETLDHCRGANPDCTDPRLTPAYFFLGNSYDNQYRPARRGEPANDQLLTKAIENYKKAAEVVTEPLTKQRAMEYLVAAYGPDKLNEPGEAEPILRRMIELDPSEPSNYTYSLAYLRRERRLRSGRAAASEGTRHEADRFRRVRDARGLLQPPG